MKDHPIYLSPIIQTLKFPKLTNSKEQSSSKVNTHSLTQETCLLRNLSQNKIQ